MDIPHSSFGLLAPWATPETYCRALQAFHHTVTSWVINGPGDTGPCEVITAALLVAGQLVDPERVNDFINVVYTDHVQVEAEPFNPDNFLATGAGR